jgi:Tfp pilus assembly PilM family ATPase
MKNLLAVYFGNFRTYFSAIKPSKKGYELIYINNLKKTFDSILNDIIDTGNDNTIDEISIETKTNYDGLAITIPSSSVYMSILPQPFSDSSADIKRIMKFEIKTLFPNKTYEDFYTYAIGLNTLHHEPNRILAVFIPKEYINACKEFLSNLNLEIKRIGVSHLDALSAMNYNYPEKKENYNMQVCLGKNTLEISTSSKGIIQNYQASKFNKEQNLTNQIIDKINDIMKTFNQYSGDQENIKTIFVYGEGMNYNITEELKKYFKETQIEILILNAFRMFTTGLSVEHRQYCSLMSHVFPPGVGSCLPDFQKRIVID